MMRTTTLVGAAALWIAATALASPAGTSGPAPFGTAELDASIEAKAREKGLAPAAACDDATFLRRVSLDLAGVIPTPGAVEAFLKDARADKRALKIEELLAAPEFDRHTATQMRSFMMGKAEAKAIQMVARKGIEEWLEERVRAKEGYDKIVSQLLTAEGPFVDNPATGFLMRKDATPEDLTARTGKVFLGAQIQCAQCHDHPFEKWSQKDFYGMVSFFARTRTVPVPEPALELVRKGVPLPMIRQLLMGPMGDKPGFGKDKGKRKGPFANLPPEERVRRMMKRMGMEDGMEAGSGSSTGTGTGVQPPAPAEILEMAKRIRKQIEEDMAEAMPTGEPPDPTRKAKKPYRRIPVVFEAPRGEAIIPDPNAEPSDNPRDKKGTEVAPRFLDGTTPAAEGKRRQQLAAWITAPGNPYFARAAVNRFFAQLTGQPLVSPVDNVVAPSEKALAGTLDRLSEAFVRSGYDLRWLCRTVVSSRSYQRELVPAKGSKQDRLYLTHASARQLSPEQLFSSFLQATGAEELGRGTLGDRFEQLKAGFLRQFVFTFENDEGAEVELFHETIPQALMLMNSGLFNRPVQAGPGGLLAKIAAATPDPNERIDRLYLATLSRHATPAELARLTELVSARAGRVDPEMPGMDEPAPMLARDFIEDLPRPGGGRRFGMGMGMGFAQPLKALRDRFKKMRQERNEPGGWAGLIGKRGRFQDRPGPAQAALAPVSGAGPWKSTGEWQAYEDIFWSLVSCSEFLYNH